MTATAPLPLDDPAFLTGDRHVEYRALRDQGAAVALDGTWVITRHEDVHAVLRDTTGRMQPAGQDAPAWMDPGPARRRLQANMVQTDRPVHTRLRGVVAPLFTARQVEKLRAAAAAEVEAELGALPADGFDAVTDLAARAAGRAPPADRDARRGPGARLRGRSDRVRRAPRGGGVDLRDPSCHASSWPDRSTTCPRDPSPAAPRLDRGAARLVS